MLSIGEYVSTNQQAVWFALCLEYKLKSPNYYSRAAQVRRQIKRLRQEVPGWAGLMQERPKPGLGGLLPGEKGVM